MMKDGIRILRSGVSVFEVEVDLGKFSSTTTDQMGNFRRRLLRMLPGLKTHECFSSQNGGFVGELKRGTDLAHVIEHVILEILRLKHPTHKRFSGWTRKKPRTYVIHFQAPDPESGISAAHEAVKIVEALASGKRAKVDVNVGLRRRVKRWG